MHNMNTRGRFLYKKDRDACLAVLIPLGLFSLNRSTSEAFAAPFRVLSRQHDRRQCVVSKLVPLRVKNIS